MGSWLPSRRLALVVLLVVQLLSCVSLFVITWVAAHQARLFTVFWSLLKFMSIESVMVSNHLILCCPLLLLPSNFPSIFSNESVLHITWPKYWSFSLNISPSNEYSGLNSFRIGLISLQSKGLSRVLSNTIDQKHQFWHSAFMVQLSYPHMTTGKTIALTIQSFVGKVMSLLFNTLSSFSSKEQVPFNFVAAVTVHIDLRSQEYEI